MPRAVGRGFSLVPPHERAVRKQPRRSGDTFCAQKWQGAENPGRCEQGVSRPTLLLPGVPPVPRKANELSGRAGREGEGIRFVATRNASFTPLTRCPAPEMQRRADAATERAGVPRSASFCNASCFVSFRRPSAGTLQHGSGPHCRCARQPRGDVGPRGFSQLLCSRTPEMRPRPHANVSPTQKENPVSR